MQRQMRSIRDTDLRIVWRAQLSPVGDCSADQARLRIDGQAWRKSVGGVGKRSRVGVGDLHL